MPRPTGYVGYYPGEKIPRTPGGKPPPSTSYDLNVLGQQIQEMEISVGGIPKWAADQIEGGIKVSLRANVFSGGLGGEALMGYSEGEMEEEISEVSGTAGLSVDLNPAEIAKDPAKWAKKTVEGAWSELNPLGGDLEARKRGRLWGSIVGIDENGEALEEITKKQALRRAGVANYQDVSTHPLSLVGEDLGAYEEQGKELAEKIVDFEGDVYTAFFRDQNFDKVMRTQLDGTRKILADNLGNLRGGATGDNAAVALEYIGEIDMAKKLESVEKAKKDFVDTMGRFRTESSPLSKKAVYEEVTLSDGTTAKRVKKYEALSLQKQKEALEKAINEAKAHKKLLTHGIEGLTTEEGVLLGIWDESRNFNPKNVYAQALEGRGGAVLTAARKQELSGIFSRTDSVIGRIEGALPSELPKNNWSLTLERRLEAAASDLTGDGSRLHHNSVERALLRNVSNRAFTGEASAEELVRGVSEDGYQYCRRSKLLMPTLEADRRFFMVDDLMDTMYSDKLWDKYIWMARINPRLKAITPGYWTGEFMKKMHFFGLKIDEGSIIDANGQYIKPKFFLYKWANKAVKKYGAFANKFDIDIKGIGRRAVVGGHHFAAVKEIKGFLDKNKISPDDLKQLMRIGSTEELIEKLRSLELFKDEKKLAEFASKFQSFQRWAKKNAKRLGIDLEKGEHLKSLIDALMSYERDKVKNIGIGITRAFRGKLEQIVQKLSILQNKIFKGVFGKVAGKFLSWKMAVSTAISEAIMDALGVASGGAAFLLKPLQLVLQSVVRVALDVGEKFVLSIVKADFGELGKFMDKQLTNVVKLFAYLAGGITVASAIPFIIIVAILSALSPVNDAKVSGVGGEQVRGGPGELPPGSGTLTCNTADWADLDPRNDPKTPLGFSYSSVTNAAAIKAYDIVDELRAGYWCYWNYSPDYPHLFNLSVFQSHPNHCVYNCNRPAGCTEPGTCPPLDAINLHWCTHLTIHAYDGYLPHFTNSTWTPTQAQYFKDNYGYVMANESNIHNKVGPGDAIFFRNSERQNHVGVVYYVTSDYIVTVESNASIKSRTIILSGSNHSVEAGQGVDGFGIIPKTEEPPHTPI